MNKIAVLDQSTIDKIAAGEVIERPASVVKELVENAIDAGANAITVEIKEGGITFIRITDNGEGIAPKQVPLAFLRHATSKISRVEDLLNVASLGFRGEALSSIAAVCQVELITKTAGNLTGVRYVIEGGMEKGMEEIGAPEGTTFLVRNLFYNTPARKKFLKTPMTEAGYINDLMERMALSHPEIAFKFINNNQTRLHTSGNTNLKDIIYGIYGREIAANLVEIDTSIKDVTIRGFIGKPVISRGNRNYENYFINGRYIRSSILSKAIEEAYRTFMMQHKYPFTALHFTIDGKLLDINVHPTKMELRFADNQQIFQLVCDTVREGLTRQELIPQVTVASEKHSPEIPPMKQVTAPIPEPFEHRLLEKQRREKPPCDRAGEEKARYHAEPVKIPESRKNTEDSKLPPQQIELFEDKLLSKENVKEHRIIGQVFDTYWLVEFQEKLYIIDQHAAHEKVLYERTMAGLEKKEFTSQQISPPLILSLSLQEEELLAQYMENFTQIGYEIEHFGGKEYSIRAVPANLFGLAEREVFLEMLDGLAEQTGRASVEMINEKIASMSCKAAVKGNHKMSFKEAQALIDELMSLENPYNCPHGRPTIISMTKYELEKKFKRIV